jgi:hypothetical protein
MAIGFALQRHVPQIINYTLSLRGVPATQLRRRSAALALTLMMIFAVSILEAPSSNLLGHQSYLHFKQGKWLVRGVMTDSVISTRDWSNTDYKKSWGGEG